MMGYPIYNKGYRLWDGAIKRIVTARSVQFDESQTNHMKITSYNTEDQMTIGLTSDKANISSLYTPLGTNPQIG